MQSIVLIMAWFKKEKKDFAKTSHNFTKYYKKRFERKGRSTIMHFLTAQFKGKTFVGLTDEAQQYVIDLNETERVKNGVQTLPQTLDGCIELGDSFLDTAASLRDWVLTQREAPTYFYKMEKVTLLAPIPRPAKNVLCVGKNYKEHVLEMGSEGDIPEHIMIFTKAPTSVIGDGNDIFSSMKV
jgi:2-keto-4-pentenoate hydratase/2-oxohepta-3-ene-1,7-dioic acid hydratase in catechol pathway